MKRKSLYDDQEPDLALGLIGYIRDDIDEIKDCKPEDKVSEVNIDAEVSEEYVYGNQLFGKYYNDHPDYFKKSDAVFNSPEYFEE